MGDKTKDEIIDYMRKNFHTKVSHWLFASDEYIYMKPDGNIYTEEGYLFEDFHTARNNNGMRIRTGRHWETGWKILK